MIRRREIIICTGGGFAYLLCHGLTFLCAGLLSFALPAVSAVWAYVIQPLTVAVALRNPHLVPVLTAVVFGAHLPVLAWLWQHRLYAWLGGALIALGVALLMLTGKGAFHFAGVAAGIVLLIASLPAYRHAAAVANRVVDPKPD